MDPACPWSFWYYSLSLIQRPLPWACGYFVSGICPFSTVFPGKWAQSVPQRVSPVIQSDGEETWNSCALHSSRLQHHKKKKKKAFQTCFQLRLFWSLYYRLNNYTSNCLESILEKMHLVRDGQRFLLKTGSIFFWNKVMAFIIKFSHTYDKYFDYIHPSNALPPTPNYPYLSFFSYYDRNL